MFASITPNVTSSAIASKLRAGELEQVTSPKSGLGPFGTFTGRDRRSMPTPNTNDPNHWRNRAAQMRALALTMNHSDVVTLMKDLATDYDMLADRAARRTDGSKPPTKGKSK
jgi:hypothetical protein